MSDQEMNDRTEELTGEELNSGSRWNSTLKLCPLVMTTNKILGYTYEGRLNRRPFPIRIISSSQKMN